MQKASSKTQVIVTRARQIVLVEGVCVASELDTPVERANKLNLSREPKIEVSVSFRSILWFCASLGILQHGSNKHGRNLSLRESLNK